MILIEEVEYKSVKVKFYNGVDFDRLLEHSKDGSDGFIFCFIDCWIRELQSYNRNSKLKSLTEGVHYNDFDWKSIDNNYITIYQADGINIDLLFSAIREKVLHNHLPTAPYLHISEVSDSNITSVGGAWKLEVGKIQN